MFNYDVPYLILNIARKYPIFKHTPIIPRPHSPLVEHTRLRDLLFDGIEGDEAPNKNPEIKLRCDQLVNSHQYQQPGVIQIDPIWSDDTDALFATASGR